MLSLTSFISCTLRRAILPLQDGMLYYMYAGHSGRAAYPCESYQQIDAEGTVEVCETNFPHIRFPKAARAAVSQDLLTGDEYYCGTDDVRVPSVGELPDVGSGLHSANLRQVLSCRLYFPVKSRSVPHDYQLVRSIEISVCTGLPVRSVWQLGALRGTMATAGRVQELIRKPKHFRLVASVPCASCLYGILCMRQHACHQSIYKEASACIHANRQKRCCCGWRSRSHCGCLVRGGRQ